MVDQDVEAGFFVFELTQGNTIEAFVFLAGNPIGIEAMFEGIGVAARWTTLGTVSWRRLVCHLLLIVSRRLEAEEASEVSGGPEIPEEGRWRLSRGRSKGRRAGLNIKRDGACGRPLPGQILEQ